MYYPCEAWANAGGLWPTMTSSGLCFVRVAFARLHRSLWGVQGGLQQFRQLSLLYLEQVGGSGGPKGPHWENRRRVVSAIQSSQLMTHLLHSSMQVSK